MDATVTPVNKVNTADDVIKASTKSNVELLLNEVGKTHDRIQKLQTALDNLRHLMTQEYANFHNALHEGKQQNEILKDRVENEEMLCKAKNEKLRQQLENTEKRVSYQINALAVDMKDEIGNLNLAVLAINKMKRNHPNGHPTGDSNEPYSSTFTQYTISGIQIFTDFCLWMFSCLLYPIANFFGLIQVIFMMTVVWHVFCFMICNVLCSNQGFNLFSMADDIRNYFWPPKSLQAL